MSKYIRTENFLDSMEDCLTDLYEVLSRYDVNEVGQLITSCSLLAMVTIKEAEHPGVTNHAKNIINSLVKGSDVDVMNSKKMN